ncbi:hypothetical protein ACMFMF_004400 [Clarireedia jacksonii]
MSAVCNLVQATPYPPIPKRMRSTPAITATPTYTVPTGFPSCIPGPATPVVLIPQVVSLSSPPSPSLSSPLLPKLVAPLTPSAICAATSSQTTPSRLMICRSTFKSDSLTDVAYETTPPRKAALEPGTAVRAAMSEPPVRDSAAATVLDWEERRRIMDVARESRDSDSDWELMGVVHV